MAVQVWVGEKPEHPNERRTIVALANGLERLESLYLLLANFNVGGRTIDLVVIKRDAVFLIELKHCDGKVSGSVNGPWYVESVNGERKRLNPGRKNPYNQIISYYYSLTNFLNDHRPEIVSASKATTINFRTCKRLVVIAPTIQDGSDISLDWRVDVKGIDELPAFLVTEGSPQFELTEEEMLTIPQILGCTRWHDVNEVLTISTPPAEEIATAPPPPAPPTVHLATPTSSDMSITTGRLALAMSILTMLLLLLFVWQAPTLLTNSFDQDRTSMIRPSSGRGVFDPGSEAYASGCVWSGFQSVGKQWDVDERRWISVGVDGTVVSPDIVVTLEQVDYCHQQIVLTWSIHNNSTRTIFFPVSRENITIRDPLGNEYVVSDEVSTPNRVRIRPGEHEQVTAVVPRPVIQNTPSLLVRLREQPFGEASWLVSLEGNY